jgi:hypothetical protein
MLTNALIALALTSRLLTAGSTLAAQKEACCANPVNQDRSSLTPVVVGKVNGACVLPATEGPAALPTSRVKNSPLLYEGKCGFTPWLKPNCWCLRSNTSKRASC